MFVYAVNVLLVIIETLRQNSANEGPQLVSLWRGLQTIQFFCLYARIRFYTYFACQSAI